MTRVRVPSCVVQLTNGPLPGCLAAAYPGDLMLFMDFRRHHTGLWDSGASRLTVGQHPNAGDGQWGTAEEVGARMFCQLGF